MVVDRIGGERIEGEPSEEAKRADGIFHALADATRRDIVLLTMDHEQSVSALARRYPMSFAAVQKHVAVLERAQLVTKRRHGREQLVRGNAVTVREAHRLLDELEAVWRGRIDRFGELLADRRDPSTVSDPSHTDRRAVVHTNEGAAPCP
jgi:DNA-binding transcriptional ArsR family regulator